jgi:hypothetical protein
MPLYDLHCTACDRRWERSSTIAHRQDPCEVCGGAVEQEFNPASAYHPFAPYFDIALGCEVTSLAHRWRLMKEHHLDYRDKMSPGDLSARLDRIHEAQGRGIR